MRTKFFFFLTCTGINFSCPEEREEREREKKKKFSGECRVELFRVNLDFGNTPNS